ncbi:unnamed protein product [Adineta steineri]|uniref:Phytanoyl-CoA dioxygenase n=1 Tax=Adineta steineri TaxID=433720 RepID=A0A815LHV3_9BILA|nr:unnamed protein product [Adineta steineri]CAF1403480.1 unnamed protein product [Adineta steineri]
MGQYISTSSSIKTARSNSISPIDYEFDSPRFTVNDAEQIQQGIDHLNEHGYAVFSTVLSPNEITLNIDLLWEHFESLLPPYFIKRDDAKTWDDAWPGAPEFGILSDDGFGHSQFMWSIRGNPNVKKIFTEIWKTPELLVSFDAAGCFRDWHINPFWKTVSGWYHCDQNPMEKSNRCSIQGFVSLTDNDESTGGLVVVPQSHKHFDELRSIADKNNAGTNSINVPKTHSLLQQFQPRLVKCQAGDLVVFDSRCIHCNTPGLDTNSNIKKIKSSIKSQYPRLLRIVAYICMSPTAMVPPDKLDKFRETRKGLVIDRKSCTHWPAELHVSGGPQHGIAKPLRLSTYQQSLIFGTDIEFNDETTSQLTDM